MNVLVACEYSGRVRDAFTRRGHFAVSCDLLPTETPGKHFMGDVRLLLKKKWDLVIAFPPCTNLSSIGAAHWAKWQADGTQQEAIDFFMLFARYPGRVAIENPAGRMSSYWRRPDQYIQPWWFGDPWIKRTGLWLKGLPLLVPTRVVEPQGHWVDGGTYSKATSSKFTRISTGAEGAYASTTGPKTLEERAKERSRTFQGVANAMARQWG